MMGPSTEPLQQGEQEKAWLLGLRAGREEALEAIFNRYYRYLTVTGYQLVHDENRAQDIAQDLFFKLWTQRDTLAVTGSLKAYLRKAMVNRCIDHIRRQRRENNAPETSIPQRAAEQPNADDLMAAGELQQLINAAVDGLPPRCRVIFSLSRFHDLSNKEIAQKLDISVKTVENQMTKALKQLRMVLARHLPAWLIFLVLSSPSG